MNKYPLVINTAIGGFSLTREAILLGRKISKNPLWGGAVLIGDEDWIDDDYTSSVQVKRHDAVLIEVYKQLGDNASPRKGALKLIYIDCPEYTIYTCDTGPETVTPKNKFEFQSVLDQ